MTADQNTSASPGQALKDFVCVNTGGVLSTVSHSCPGYPFGSVVPYDVAPGGQLVIFISKISEHYRNLRHDPKASLLIADLEGADDPQPYTRATLLGDFMPVPEKDLAAVTASYWQRFPQASSRSLAHDFVFYWFQPQRVRWIGGFGDIRWIDGKSYQDAVFDPVAYHGRGICNHMNEDHRDALAELVKHQHGISAAPAACKMIDVNGTGFSVAVNLGTEIKRLQLNFPAAAKAPNDVRRILIELLKIARNADDA